MDEQAVGAAAASASMEDYAPQQSRVAGVVRGLRQMH